MLRLLLPIITILSLLLASSDDGQSASAQTKSQKPSGTSPEEQAPMRINTALVTLNVGVNDKKGRPVANLRKASFEIFEDGKLQTIEFFGQEDQPISFGLLIDRSQSMNESAKIENAKAVAISFLRAGNPQNEAFCLAFKTRQGYRLSEPRVSAAAERSEVRTTSEQTSTVVITPPKRIQHVEELAPSILQENFDNPSGSLVKWPQSGKCSVRKGKLFVAEECIVPVGTFIYDDFEATVTATIIIPPQRSAGSGSSSTSGSLSLPDSIDLSVIGLRFRINENGYYTLMLAPASGGRGGLYKLIKVADGKQTEITSWRRDAAIATRNQIKLRCADSKIEIYVNNLRLDTLKDDSHKRGSISLVFSGESGMFDDLTVKKMN